MREKSRSFGEKILNYSLTAGAVLTAQSNILASVVVTNSFNNGSLPATRNTNGASFNIDFENGSGDGDDFTIRFQGTGTHSVVKAVNINPSHEAFFLGNAGGANTWYAAVINQTGSGVPVTPGGGNGWGQDNFTNAATLNFKGTAGHWVNQTNKYLGVKFLITGVTHYGWVKMSVNAAGTSFTIDSWAYETLANTGISSPLPVELTSFNAAIALTQNAVVLNWTTATEVNNYGFDVERQSPETGEWTKIGFVKGSGTSNSTKEYSFTDDKVTTGTYKYRLKQIDIDGKFEYSDEVSVNYSGLVANTLEQNYPNPFNPTTVIKYNLASKGEVQLKVYDILGKQVAELVNGEKPAGSYEVSFNAEQYGLTSGMYVYELTTPEYKSVKKMLLIK